MWQTTVFIVLYFITSYFATAVPSLVEAGLMRRNIASWAWCITCHVCILVMSIWYFGSLVGIILSLLYFFSVVRIGISWVISVPFLRAFKKSYWRSYDPLGEMNGKLFGCLGIDTLVCVLYMTFSILSVPFEIGKGTVFYGVAALIIFILLWIVGFVVRQISFQE